MANELLDPHAALIHIMVLVSAADNDMTDRELRRIGDTVKTLPVFVGFDPEQLLPISEDCARRLNEEDGLEQLLRLIAASLPDRLIETAYAVACEVAAAERRIEPEELRILQLIRHRLNIERLTAAAIERGVRARNARL